MKALLIAALAALLVAATPANAWGGKKKKRIAELEARIESLEALFPRPAPPAQGASGAPIARAASPATGLGSITPTSDDIMYVVDDPGGTPASKKTTITNLGAAIEASLVGAFTDGSVIFVSSGDLAEDNASLFWDDSNDRLGVGTATPQGQARCQRRLCDQPDRQQPLEFRRRGREP